MEINICKFTTNYWFLQEFGWDFLKKIVMIFWGEGLQRRRRLWVSVLNSKLVLPTGDAVVDYY